MQPPSMRWIVTLAIVAAIAAWVWWQTRPEPVAVQVRAVDRGTVERTVSNTRSGTVKACRRAKLSPSVGGQIASLPVREGDHVKRGDLLLELWNRDIAAESALAGQEALAATSAARAACIKAEQTGREAERLSRLGRRKLLSEDQVDKAVAAAQAGRADCESADAVAAVRKARLDVLDAQLEKTRLLAPFDGVVAEINGELNEYVTPSPPGIATQPAIDLIDNRCFYVAAPIDEVDVAAVTVGQTARVSLDAFGDRRLDGRVRRISNYVLDKEKQARTVEVEVALVDASDQRPLLAGYSADVDIVLETRTDSLRVPSAAVIDGSRVYVLPAGADTIGVREIGTGISNWDYTEVTAGLQAGDQVVTNVDADGIADGVRVTRKSATGADP